MGGPIDKLGGFESHSPHYMMKCGGWAGPPVGSLPTYFYYIFYLLLYKMNYTKNFRRVLRVIEKVKEATNSPIYAVEIHVMVLFQIVASLVTATWPSLTRTLTGYIFHIRTQIWVLFVLLEWRRWALQSGPHFTSIWWLWFFEFLQSHFYFWSHLDHSSRLMRFWATKSFYQSISKWGDFSLTFSFLIHRALLGCIPLKAIWRYPTSPHREFLVFLTRMISLGSLSKYLGAKSSTIGTCPTSLVSMIKGGS